MKGQLKVVCGLVFFMVSTISMALPIGFNVAMEAGHRSVENSLRDQYRHPKQTLEFFRLSPEQTVVEIWPGGGWYTEILAPYLKGEGRYYAAHFEKNGSSIYFSENRAVFDTKLQADPENYQLVQTVVFNPGKKILSVPEATADRVLTFRNVHNWLRDDSEETAFKLFFKTLKPGGLLGVVEHQSPGGKDRPWMLKNGYMGKNYVIALARDAGFQLLETSDINENLADDGEHPSGVWTLPPRLRLGAKNKDHYLTIGESNRMTLLFLKPTSEVGTKP